LVVLEWGRGIGMRVFGWVVEKDVMRWDGMGWYGKQDVC
jgi:hypothetical protein